MLCYELRLRSCFPFAFLPLLLPLTFPLLPLLLPQILLLLCYLRLSLDGKTDRYGLAALLIGMGCKDLRNGAISVTRIGLAFLALMVILLCVFL